MNPIPTHYYVQTLMAEHEHEARRAHLAKVARLARTCCEASAGLLTRLARAIRGGQTAPACPCPTSTS